MGIQPDRHQQLRLQHLMLATSKETLRFGRIRDQLLYESCNPSSGHFTWSGHVGIAYWYATDMRPLDAWCGNEWPLDSFVVAMSPMLEGELRSAAFSCDEKHANWHAEQLDLACMLEC